MTSVPRPYRSRIIDLLGGLGGHPALKALLRGKPRKPNAKSLLWFQAFRSTYLDISRHVSTYWDKVKVICIRSP